jgi:predicted phage terminase large subunit-like protein
VVSDLPLAEVKEIQALPPDEFERLWEELEASANPEDAQAALKARCETDRTLFATYFFEEKLSYPFSDFHLASLNVPKVAYRVREQGSGSRRATMGPRGNGKTSVYIGAEVLHDICYAMEQFIVIICEGFTLSKSRLREIRIELESNTLLREFFGNLQGDIWQAEDIETRNGIRVLARSMSGQVRGILHPTTGARPTKIILDDAEDSHDVLNPDLRARDQRIFTQDIEGAAATDGRTNMQMTGTPLHRAALLPSLAYNPGWTFQTFPAIVTWPKRMDLWEKCRRIWAAAGEVEELARDATLSERMAAARAADERTVVAKRYYHANKKRMDEDARVLWPEGEPLFQLMTWWWTNGDAAFSKEKLLVPKDAEVATFEMDADDYPVHGALRHTIHQTKKGPVLLVDQRNGKARKVRIADLRFVAFHDPAKADPRGARTRVGKGDYAAIVTMGIETLSTGGTVGHVVDAWVERKSVSKQITQAFALAEFWRHGLFMLEEMTLGLLKKAYADEREKRRRLGEFYQVPLRALEAQTQNKDARIAAMEPAVTNGWLTFNRSLPRLYWEQMIDHPTGDHDDGPDATENCWRRRSFKKGGLTLVSLAA